jgi:hypothetical protein
MRLVCEEPILQPREVRPDFPEKLEQIILRSLERDLDKRYPSARELRKDLMAWLAEEGHLVGKRQVAEYLRAVFGAQRVHESDEFGAEDDAHEDLILEKGLPKLDGSDQLPLWVDSDEPEETSGQYVGLRPVGQANGAPGSSAARSPIPELPLIADPLPSVSLGAPVEVPTGPIPVRTETSTASADTRKIAVDRSVSMVVLKVTVVVLVIAAALYFILHG